MVTETYSQVGGDCFKLGLCDGVSGQQMTLLHHVKYNDFAV